LERHVDIMRTNHRHAATVIKEWTITRDDPARVILVDEAGQLFRPNTLARSKTDRRGYRHVDVSVRKCGYVVVACTQHSNLSRIPIRHGLTLRGTSMKSVGV
jgi:hypothetical protein